MVYLHLYNNSIHDVMCILQTNIDFFIVATVHCPSFMPFLVYSATQGFFLQK